MQSQQFLATDGNWTVWFNDDKLDFKSFQSAVSYADGAASQGRLVKEILPESRMIKLIKSKRGSTAPIELPESLYDRYETAEEA